MNSADSRGDRGEPVILHARVGHTAMSSTQWGTLLHCRLAMIDAKGVIAEMHTAKAGNAYLILTPGPGADKSVVDWAAAAITAEPHTFGLLEATPTRRLQDSPLWSVR